MVYIRQLLLLLLIFFASFFAKWVIAGNKAYKVDRSGNCPKVRPNMTIDFSGFGKVNEVHSFRFTGAINVTRDVKGILSMKLNIKKCNPQCEDFTEKIVDNECADLLNNIYVGDAFTKITVPSFRCPIKKGLYVATNYLVDMSRIDNLPFANLKYIVTHEFFESESKRSNGGKQRSLGCWLLHISRTIVNNRKRGEKGK